MKRHGLSSNLNSTARTGVVYPIFARILKLAKRSSSWRSAAFSDILPHVIRQMSRPDRMISARDVGLVAAAGEFLEDYPENVRGHSCLLLGFGVDRRPIHIVCSPKPDYLAIITAYRPHPADWTSDFKQRRQS